MNCCWMLFLGVFIYSVPCFASPARNAAENSNSEGVGGFLVVAGGYKNGKQSQDVYMLNTYTREWSSLADLPKATEGSQLFYADGKLISTGGDPTPASFLMYNSSGPTWTSLPDLTKGVGWGVCGSILDDSLYLIGGSADGSGTQVMNPFTFPIWTPAAHMQEARMLCGAATLGDYIYTCGNQFTGANGKTCEKYDPATKSWSSIASMIDYRMGKTLVTLNGYLYAVGGNTLGTAERYDPSTNTWTYIQPVINHSRTVSAAATDGKLIYLAGGCDGVVGGCPPGSTETNEVEVYTPELNQWTVLPPMPDSREDVAIAYLPQLPN